MDSKMRPGILSGRITRTQSMCAGKFLILGLKVTNALPQSVARTGENRPIRIFGHILLLEYPCWFLRLIHTIV